MKKYGIFVSSVENVPLALISLTNDDSISAHSAANDAAFRLWLALGAEQNSCIHVRVAAVETSCSIYSASIRFEDADPSGCFNSDILRVYRTYRIFGEEGHRQAVSFGPSSWCATDKFAMEVRCSDRTGTNEYVDVAVYGPDIFACDETIEAQVWDGLFENSRVGYYIDLDSKDSPDLEQGAAKYRLEQYLRSYDMIENYAGDGNRAPFVIRRFADRKILVAGINIWNAAYGSAEGLLILDPDTGHILDRGWNTPNPCGCEWESGACWSTDLTRDWTGLAVEDRNERTGSCIDAAELGDTDIVPEAVVRALRVLTEQACRDRGPHEDRILVSKCERLRIPLECAG